MPFYTLRFTLLGPASSPPSTHPLSPFRRPPTPTCQQISAFEGPPFPPSALTLYMHNLLLVIQILKSMSNYIAIVGNANYK